MNFLDQNVGNTIPSKKVHGDESFYSEVCSLAERLLVSRECLLRRLQKAVEDNEMGLADSFCLLMFGYSDRTPRGRSFWKPRIAFALTPSVLNGAQIRIHSGMEIENLGTDAACFIKNLLTGDERLPAGRLDLPLEVTCPAARFRRSPLKVILNGWWKTLSFGAGEKSMRVLVWGYLHTA